MVKISIITICLNSEKTIARTIDSVLSQHYKNLEYIIVDGLSTDSTMEIVRSYGDRITRVISEKDNGISDAFNKGIRAATGDIIGIINSDDLMAEGSLQAIGDQLKEDTDVLYGNMITFGEDISTQLLKPGNPEDMRKTMSIYHPATLITKRAYEKYGLYDVTFRCTMDRELLLRMLTKGAKFQYIDATIACFQTGGVSDKKFLKGTLPEDARASLMYGRSKAAVRMDTARSLLRYRISRILRNSKVGKSVLKKYHKKQLVEE